MMKKQVIASNLKRGGGFCSRNTVIESLSDMLSPKLITHTKNIKEFLKTKVFCGLTFTNDKTKIKNRAVRTVPNDTMTFPSKRVIIKNSLEYGGYMKKGFAMSSCDEASNQCNKFRKRAFTLAEILITIGILGIVAVLVVPKQVQKYYEKEKIAKVKKVYSTLSRAMTSIVNEHGTIDTWNLSKSFGSVNPDGSFDILETDSMDILINRMSKYIKHKRLEKNWSDNIVTTNLQNVPVSKQNWPNAMFLPDGTVLMIGQIYSNEQCARSDLSKKDLCSTIVVWFPDSTKKRIEGVNQFDFYVMKDRIIPWGVQNDANNTFRERCNKNINNRYSGRGCTAWVVYNGNMDYLHCSDLSWNGKKKCK